MRRLQSLAILLIAASANTEAGCIGPVIMGKCHGKEVQWDTGSHGTDLQRQKSGFELAPREGSSDEIPLPGLPDRTAPKQGLDRFYGPDPRYSTPAEPQEHRGRFR